MTTVKLLVTSLLVCAASGCGLLRDPRNTPWDPPHGRTLTEQIPNWDGEALRVCGGHLPDTERGDRSPRC